MALFTKHAKGLLENTEEIVLVPSSAAGANIITMFRLINLDTEDITFKLRVYDEAKLGFDDEYVYVIPETTLATQEYITHSGPMLALASRAKLVIELNSAVTTNQPQYQVIYVEEG